MIRKEFVNVKGKPTARVTFALPAGSYCADIHLVGDFNNWDRTSHPLQKDAHGIWTLTVDLEPQRTYQFRYLCDGLEWMCDSGADAYVYSPQGAHSFVVITDPNFKRYDRA